VTRSALSLSAALAHPGYQKYRPILALVLRYFRQFPHATTGSVRKFGHNRHSFYDIRYVLQKLMAGKFLYKSQLGTQPVTYCYSRTQPGGPVPHINQALHDYFILRQCAECGQPTILAPRQEMCPDCAHTRILASQRENRRMTREMIKKEKARNGARKP